MTSGTQSKAQRRAESQRKAAERRAAELRAKRMRLGFRYGGLLVVVAVIAVIIISVTGGSSPKASQGHKTAADVKTSSIPSSLQMVADPATTPGYEGIPIALGPKLATVATSATGQAVDGIQCNAGEQTVTHVHTHLTIFVNGKARVIPYGIGIPGAEPVATPKGAFVETGSCFYWLHTHQEDGIIHIESPSTSETFTLGQFFAEWGQPLSKTQIGPAKGKLTVFFTAPGKKVGIYKGNPADLPLGSHYQIQVDVGTPIVKPVDITSWGSL
jgi:hypothetical protein